MFHGRGGIYVARNVKFTEAACHTFCDVPRQERDEKMPKTLDLPGFSHTGRSANG
jgi:hypothetical protein